MTTRDPAAVIAEITRAFGKIPLQFRQEVRVEMMRVASPMLAQAKANASWSTRIPGAIRASARLSKKRQGFSIIVNRKKAPHGRAFEGLTRKGNTFRHPVFGEGDRGGYWTEDTWVEQETRPYVWPAVEANKDKALDAVGQAIEASARKHGFR